MPSELQRVARGLVDCFDEVPRVVDQLVRTAARCRENAQLALIASRGQATVAAQQLDAAARACEAAAHYLSMAPPKARGWAEGLIGEAGPSTNRPSSDSAKRNKSTSGTGVRIHTARLTATYEDLEVAEDNEPPLVTVARKAFEKYREADERDTGNQEPLEVEITVTETGELILEERDKKEEAKREERLTRDFEFAPDRDDRDEPPEYEERDEKEEAKREERLTRDFEFVPDRDDEEERPEFEERDEKEEEKRAERLTADHEIDVALAEEVKLLLATMAESDGQAWQHATLTITLDKIEATFDYAEEPHFALVAVDIDLPEHPTLDFDPATHLGPLGADFVPGVYDPMHRFLDKEREIAQRLAEEGWRIDARPEDHGSGKKNPDVILRRSDADEGSIAEFKTQDRGTSNAVKRNMLAASGQAFELAQALSARHEVVIDGRAVGVSEETASRSFRRALGQPGSTVAPVVRVILGDGSLVTFTKEQ
ncbi:hypothetical protein GCM10009742_07940 [Kribbella karoonensis]|uniref:tRNA nuclease CdiA C-terminal domain-containing protein n=1 Tax=Kribbella karoonensis TaxID=324851 RepID=A0ABN2D244_9ACTN